MNTEIDLVKQLRIETGAGIIECQKAIKEAQGDLEKAKHLLRLHGAKIADKRKMKSTNEGIIYSYIHGNGRLGVLLELNCETDFVARTDDFRELAKDVAMQIAATAPNWIDVDGIPENVIASEKEVYMQEVKGKPENIVEKIIEGRMQKFYKDVCLLHQEYIKDPKKTIQDHINEIVSKTGENIKVKRFCRFVLGN